MPIECKFQVKPLDQDAFHAIDKVVMGHAFDIHNEMGRFLDERIYQDELAYRCIDTGLDILREPAIYVTHKDFSKPYFLDALANTGAIYELKAVKALNGNHETQLINYLLLTGLNHGKLVNMRPASVEYRYVSTQLTEVKGHNYSFNMEGWTASAPGADLLHNTLHGLLEDWGAFLDINLYREALVHFLGGVDQVIQFIDIRVDGRMLGKQKVSLVGSNSAFHISAIKAHHGSYQKHMTRLLDHSSLQRIYWINFQAGKIQFKTL
jgi:GxxExxY protein